MLEVELSLLQGYEEKDPRCPPPSAQAMRWHSNMAQRAVTKAVLGVWDPHWERP